MRSTDADSHTVGRQWPASGAQGAPCPDPWPTGSCSGSGELLSHPEAHGGMHSESRGGTWYGSSLTLWVSLRTQAGLCPALPGAASGRTPMGPSQACRHRSQAGSACGSRVPPEGTQRAEAALVRLEDPLPTQPWGSVGTASSPHSGTLALADSSPGRHLHGTLGQPTFQPPDGPQKGGECPQSTWGVPCWVWHVGTPLQTTFPQRGRWVRGTGRSL